jgi:hypothetical protein
MALKFHGLTGGYGHKWAEMLEFFRHELDFIEQCRSSKPAFSGVPTEHRSAESCSLANTPRR